MNIKSVDTLGNPMVRVQRCSSTPSNYLSKTPAHNLTLVGVPMRPMSNLNDPRLSNETINHTHSQKRACSYNFD